jgi:hypothetical protein
VPIERGLRNVEPGRERRGRHLLGARILEHRRERLQDLQTAFAGFAGHGCRATVV